MMRLFTVILLLICIDGSSQNAFFPTANAHSHNDYEQKVPFNKAWENKFGSIEADVFLFKGKLVVAHERSQLKRLWTLDSLYLKPLQKCIEKNGGNVYADKMRSLQLMIDIKSEAIPTLSKLVDVLKNYPSLINCSSLRIAISGNRPPPLQFSSYPSWIYFDGEMQKEYSMQQLERIEMFSDNFARYSGWQGSGEIPEKDKQALQDVISKVHGLGKKVRFWNAPDTPGAWRIFLDMGVDYINTDKIEELSGFLEKEAQQYKQYRKGYLFFKYEKDANPGRMIFVEKDFSVDDSKNSIVDRFDINRDTGILIFHNFLEKSGRHDSIFREAPDVGLWSEITMNENDTLNTYRHEMRVVPVILEMIMPQARFSEFAPDDFESYIFSKAGPVVKNCRHQTQDFGVVRRILRAR